MKKYYKKNCLKMLSVFLVFNFVFSFCGSLVFGLSVNMVERDYCDNFFMYNLYDDDSAEITGVLQYARVITVPTCICRDGRQFFITKIGKEAFRLADVEEVRFDADTRIEEFGEGAFYQSRLHRMCVPSTLKRICKGCFSTCYYLTSFEFKEGSLIEEIGEGAFAHSSIKWMYIPPSVRALSLTFFDCRNLRFVTIHNSTELLGEYDGESIFGSCPNLICVTVLGGVRDINFFPPDDQELFYGIYDKFDVGLGDQISQTQFIKKR